MRAASLGKQRGKMALPGLEIVTLRGDTPDFTSATYSQLAADTLGNVGADGDDLAVSADALAWLMASYEQEVSDGLAAEDVPTFDGAPFDTTVEDGMLAALAVADAEETAIGAGLDFLFNNFGVWQIIPGILDFITFTRDTLISWVVGIEDYLLSLLNIYTFPTGGPPSDCFGDFCP
jgi:hypothetical protein